VAARILTLLQDPSGTAAKTGFISPDNNDGTARSITKAFLDAGLRQECLVHWNVYPFWLRNPACPTTPGAVRAQCAGFLRELTAETTLPNLCAVITVGSPAKRAWEDLSRGTSRLAELPVHDIPHPSYGGWGKTLPDGRLGIEKVRTEVAAARDACLSY
jgi:hypothetical protein